MWQRLSRVVRSFVGFFISVAEDPELILQQNIRDMNDQVPRMNESIAMVKANVTLLEKEEAKYKNDVAGLTAKVKVAIQANRDDLAGSFAAQLEQTKGALARNQGQLANARAAFAKMFQVPPDSAAAYLFTARLLLRQDFGTIAEEYGKKAIELDPHFPIGYGILAFAYIALDRLGEAENAFQRAAEHNLEIPDFSVGRYEIAFLKGDLAGMEREAVRAQGKSGAEDLLSNLDAFTLAYSGHLQQARRKSQQAVNLAQQSAQRDKAALFETGVAVWEAYFGNVPAADRNAMAALELSKDRDVEYGAGLALAISGDFSRFQTLTSDLEKRFPEDTSVKFSYLPVLRARMALNHSDPSKAIELLQIAVPYELGVPQSTFFGFFGALYPVYVRGEAYLALHQGAEAAAEFQKIIDHPGVVLNDPVAVLARLQLGRAYALAGDKNKAKAAYQDFLTRWRDADPDIPILKQARMEFAKLQ